MPRSGLLKPFSISIFSLSIISCGTDQTTNHPELFAWQSRLTNSFQTQTPNGTINCVQIRNGTYSRTSPLIIKSTCLGHETDVQPTTTTVNLDTNTLQQINAHLNAIDMDSLSDNYKSEGGGAAISDGSVYTFQFSKEQRQKTVSVDTYDVKILPPGLQEIYLYLLQF